MSRRRERFGRHDRDRLRAAILDGDALVPLIRSDPRRAAELLRAAVLDPLARSRRRLMDDEGSLHLTDAPRWLGPVPERGPFLPFLSVAPEIALALIIEIVEQATARWAERAEPEEREASFEVLIEGAPVELVGDAAVMHWHRGEGRAPAVLTTMLMALEAWLYRRLDSGEDVDATLARLLESRSVALWGLAAEIAAYRPELLRGPLTPLITGAELLIADRLYRTQPHGHQVIAALGDHAFGERIRSWNTMDHRRRALIDKLMQDVVSGEALVDELAAARSRWAERDPERLKHLLAQTDLTNLRPTQLGEDAVVWDYAPPEDLRDEVAESNEQVRATGLWLMGPYRFREAIDRGAQLDDAELDRLWAMVDGPLAEELPDDLAMGGARSRADMECGLAATLVFCGARPTPGGAGVVPRAAARAVRGPTADQPVRRYRRSGHRQLGLVLCRCAAASVGGRAGRRRPAGRHRAPDHSLAPRDGAASDGARGRHSGAARGPPPPRARGAGVGALAGLQARTAPS
jgi:hypothetical protein